MILHQEREGSPEAQERLEQARKGHTGAPQGCPRIDFPARSVSFDRPEESSQISNVDRAYTLM